MQAAQANRAASRLRGTSGSFCGCEACNSSKASLTILRIRSASGVPGGMMLQSCLLFLSST